MGYDLLHSKAFMDLAYVHSVKALLFCFEKRKVRNTGKRGKKKFEVIDDGIFQFTYDEAELRGIPRRRFGRVLRDLIEHGFIDRVKASSGLSGDCSEYRLSDRWRKFGNPDFESQTLPKGDFRFFHRRPLT